MNAEQAPVLLRFLFARTRCTAGQPAPIFRGLDEDPDMIRADLNRNDPVELEDVNNNEILSTIPDLMKILTWFLHRQPKLTRGYAQKVRDMEGWLSAAGQRGKMDRIALILSHALYS